MLKIITAGCAQALPPGSRTKRADGNRHSAQTRGRYFASEYSGQESGCQVVL